MLNTRNGDFPEIDEKFFCRDLGMDLEQLTEKVFHVAEIHIVSLGTTGCLGNFEDSSLVLVTLQKLLSVAAPLLLFLQNKNMTANTYPVVHSSSSQPLQHTSNNNPNNVTYTSQDTGCLYHRYVRMWSVISRSTINPWGVRETVRFAVLTSYFQTQLNEIRQSLQLFKKVRRVLLKEKKLKIERTLKKLCQILKF